MPGHAGEGMLRITVVDDGAEQKWILQGRLTKDSVHELLSIWQTSGNHRCERTVIVDLNDVVAIDQSGERVLAMMIEQEARLLTSGLYTRHLVEDLKVRIGRGEFAAYKQKIH